jgi:hypothetical protein
MLIGEMMPILTLDEYKCSSEEECRQMLREEKRKMFQSDPLKNNFGETSKLFSTPYQQQCKIIDFLFKYWTRITDLIFLKIMKIFSNLAHTGF